MPRSPRDAAGRPDGGQPRRDRRHVPPPAPPREPLSPSKRRIAEALAALLVAHYRRQQDLSEP